MPRYVLEGRRDVRMWCYYVGRGGLITTQPESALILGSLAESKKEVDHWRRYRNEYRWTIGKLRTRVSVLQGVMSAEEIDY